MFFSAVKSQMATVDKDTASSSKDEATICIPVQSLHFSDLVHAQQQLILYVCVCLCVSLCVEQGNPS